jgi:hypothetical protein
MGAEDTYTIKIGSTADTKGFDDLEHAAISFIDVLKAGVGLDLGGRLVSGIAEIPRVFQSAIEAGVRFNATLEQAQLGIAAVIKQFDATKTKSFDTAMEESAAAIELLKTKANETPATFEELLGAFQATSGAAQAANIPLAKHVELVTLMSQALAGLGIRKEQIIQESRALITGNITEDAAAARILGITKADVETAKAQGQLYEFLSEKMSSFAEAGKRSGQTLTTALSNLEGQLTDIEAKAAKPVFDTLKEAVLTLTEELKKPMVLEELKELGVEVAAIVKTGAGLLMWAVRNADALSMMAHGAVTLGAALAAMQIGKIVIALGVKTEAFLRVVPAIEAETAAVSRNTAAYAANAAAAVRAATEKAATPKSRLCPAGRSMKGERREFVVLHSHGASSVDARSASEALSRSYIPLGWRDARAVIDFRFVANGNRTPAAFTAFLGKPALPEAGR